MLYMLVEGHGLSFLFFFFLQIWSTLPGFSLNPTDLVAFKNIAWSLGMTIKERPEIKKKLLKNYKCIFSIDK